MPTPASFLAMLFFGAIGMGAFVYGKKMSTLPPLVLGLALMTYPYFVGGIWLWVVGVALTAGLFVWKAP